MVKDDCPNKLLKSIAQFSFKLEKTYKRIPKLLSWMYTSFAPLCFQRLSYYNATDKLYSIMHFLSIATQTPPKVYAFGLYICKYSLEAGKEEFKENRFSPDYSIIDLYFNMLKTCKKEKIDYYQPMVEEFDKSLTTCVCMLVSLTIPDKRFIRFSASRSPRR
jgi:hypothetical protein